MFNQIIEFTGGTELFNNFIINKLAKITNFGDYIEIKCKQKATSTPGILYNNDYNFKYNKIYCIEVNAESINGSKPFIFLGSRTNGGNFIQRTYIENEKKTDYYNELI
jgi:hypothetical protein